MKKIFALAFAGLMLVGTLSSSSCGNGSSNAEASETMDSLSMVFGDLYGAGMSQQFGMDSTLNINEVLEGIKFIAGADTSKSFAAGMQAGMQVAQLYMGLEQQCGMPINKNLFMEHLKAALMSKAPKSQEEMMQLQQQIQPLLDRVMAASPKAVANKKAGEEYMAKIKADKSYTVKAVSATDQAGKAIKGEIAYKVLNEGQGKTFADSATVKVNYVGKHINGEIFDQSPEGQPAVFNLQGVIPGFREMIKLMKPGEKVTVVIPGELAYGAQGNRGIDPNETLIFDLETLGVDDGKQAGMPQKPVKPSAKVGSKPLPAKNAEAAKAMIKNKK